MFLPRECEFVLASALTFALLAFRAESGLVYRRGLVGETVFDVTSYGAKPDATTESAFGMIKAWNAACQSAGPAKLLIPQGTFLTGEVIFQGPCACPKPLTVEIQGTLLSRTDLSLFTSNIWITVQYVDGVVFTGGGTLNGQGETAWEFDNGGSGGGDLLPLSLVLEGVNNSVVQDIKLVDSKGFHMKITDSTNINVTNVNINAPGDSPNTDGIHISDSQFVTISNSIIGTGDDCVSIGDGNSDITVANITCGPGHGISIGSLGKREDETDVKRVTVRNCTLIGTTNGARIKTYHDSPDLQASGIVYEDIIMSQVANPIIIDQHYNSKKNPEPSKVKITDVHFRNFRGTTTSPVAVSLKCSDAVPCEGIELSNIDLTPIGGISTLSTACSNVNPIVSGTMNPNGCPASSPADAAANAATANPTTAADAATANPPTAADAATANPPTAADAEADAATANPPIAADAATANPPTAADARADAATANPPTAADAAANPQTAANPPANPQTAANPPPTADSPTA